MVQDIRVEYKRSLTGLGGGGSGQFPDPRGAGSGGGTGTGGNYPAIPAFGGNNNNNNNPQIPSNNNYNQPWGRKKRQTQMIFQNLINVHAATLAGKIGKFKQSKI